MNKKNKPVDLDTFKTYTRDEMYNVLSTVSPTLAKGKSRAKKEELVALYAQATAVPTDGHPKAKEMAETAKKGIEAIIALQKFAGITEPYAKAEAGWNKMSGEEQQRTLEAYDAVIPKKNSPKSVEAAIAELPPLDDEESFQIGHHRATETDDVYPDGSETKLVEPNDDGVVLAGGVRENEARGVVILDLPGNSSAALAHLQHRETIRGKDVGVVAIMDEIPHVHGPNCGHDHDELPKLAGMDEMIRVNPEMPSMPTADGHVHQLPPEGEPPFTFKDGPREVTAKENFLIDRLLKNFEAFRNNPTNNDAKRNVRADIYALKVSGIIVSPLFEQAIKSGRDQVRELRRQHSTGTSVASSKDA